MEARHDSVMMEEALAALEIRPNDTVVDATLGGAGHFARLLAALGGGGTIVGIDADSEAVERARAAYAEDRRADRPTAHLVNDNFRNLTRILERLSIPAPDKMLFDLGWSGYQLASPRGFSFQEDEPLLMTYGEAGTTAADLVNTASETELADLIFAYGEERHSRKIARAIVEARTRRRILTTGQLVETIAGANPRAGKSHPATKTFQALRIAVNDELGALRDGLAAALAALAPSGRLAVISFHSIEDRIVKSKLRAAVAAGEGSLITKKPLVPSRAELLKNRRARSAKLRVYARAATVPLSEGSSPHPSAFSYAL